MRVAVLSDIHANLAALEAVLAGLGPVDAVWHLGDVVGYGADPNEVIERLAEVGAVGVRGNHDAATLGSVDLELFNPAARQALEWTREAITDRSLAWLAALPEHLVVEEFLLVHGSPREPIWEYVTTSGAARAGIEALSRHGASVGLHGHTHVPVAWSDADGIVEAYEPIDGWTHRYRVGADLLNPGSVGQPRDGDPRASFCVIDTNESEATWRRVEYPIAATQARMAAVGMPSFLVRRLSVGV
jgi:predicted phosphodiesterase